MGIFESIKNAFGGKAEQEAAEQEAKVTAGADPSLPDAELEPETADKAPGTGERSSPGTYTVQSGDTLWKISLDIYGDGSKYTKIFEANSELLKSPDQIFPGQVLVIPEL